jgi:LuxR family maltose regulon positive regulatory protein
MVSDGFLAAPTDVIEGAVQWEDLGLVDSKFQAPWSRPGIIGRPALVERLTRTRCPVVAVVGPAGYGKTTLLGQWAATSDVPVFWLTLDAHDNDPTILLEYLVAIMNRIEPADPQLWRSLLAEAAVDTNWALRRLAMLVSSRRRRFGLVVDHTESVTDPRSGDLLATVALNLPPGCRIAFASRVELPLPMARLRAEGAVEEIGVEQLAMDESEATALLGEVHAGIGATEIHELVQRTEGWPVGLYLGALTSRSGRPVNTHRAAVQGDDRMVADYLRSEVLASLSPAEITFLTRTSVLSELSGPLCDAVIGNHGSQRMLESLERSNLLLIPLDRQRRWYRCHHLLLELLRADLERNEPDLIEQLHDRAAAWFEDHDDPESAIDHALAANDPDRAARVYGRICQPAYAAGRIETLTRWVSWFEERRLLERFPHVAATWALKEALAGNGSNADLFAAAAAAGDPAALAPDGSPVAGLLALVDACRCRDGAPGMRYSAATATRLLRHDSPFQGPAILLEGVAALLQDETDAADALFTSAAATCFRYGGVPTGVAALALRASIALDRGDNAAAYELSDEAVSTAAEATLDMHAQLTVVYAVAARVAIRRGDLEHAQSHVALAVRNRPLCFPDVPFSAVFLLQLAEAYVALADPAGTRAVLHQINGVLATRSGLGAIVNRCDVLRGMLDGASPALVGASSLTAAELRLVPLLSTHLNYKEIGERLYVSRNTIKSETASIFRKLGVSSRSEAVRAAEQLGMLGPGPIISSG